MLRNMIIILIFLRLVNNSIESVNAIMFKLLSITVLSKHG